MRQVRIKVYGITLREGVGQARDCAKGKTEDATKSLLGPILLSHVIDCGPHETTDAEKKEEVSAPLDYFPDTVPDSLIVAAENAAA